MRILIDASGAIGAPSGLLRYTERLLQGLSEIDAENEYIVYAAFWNDFPGRLLRMRVPKARNFRVLPIRLPQKLLLKTEAALDWSPQEWIFRRQGADLVHGVANLLAPLRRIPSVLTLHHVGGPPETADSWERFYFFSLTRRAVLGADRVIAISEYTRQEAIRQWGVDPSRVGTVWYGGVSPAFLRPGDPGRLAALRVRTPYLLFVSAINARKNLIRLAQAYHMLVAKGFPHQLILVGQKGPVYPRLCEELDHLKIASRVRFIDSLGEEELNAVYRAADLFVYPSLLEGFGLPLIEAMACEVPVVTARTSCLPEIAGDAALYAEAEDAADLAAQMERALTDEALRSSMKTKGLARAAIFSWREAARGTLAAYAEAVKVRQARP